MRKTVYSIVSVMIALFLFYSPITASVKSVKSKDGAEIRYDDKGEGEPALVFVHGWSCDKSYWKNQFDEFSKDHKVIIIDLAGHGESGMTRKDYTVQAFGEDVAAVVNNLDIKKVILIGHSMGGAVIFEAYKLLKDKVVGLIGIDTYQSLGAKFPEDQLEKFLEPFKTDFVNQTKMFVKTLFSPDADSSLVERVANDMSSEPPDIALSAMSNLFHYDETGVLKEIDAPVISVNGTHIPTNEENNKKLLKNYKLLLVQGSGHFPMFEKPDEFNTKLHEAIDELTK